MRFGEKLQALRKARGWSQEELARQINVSRQALSKWESGAAVPDTENVVALSLLFGVTTDYLLLEEGTVTAPSTASVAAPTEENKWPVPPIVWLVVFAVAVLGKIALRIWAATLPPTVLYNGIDRVGKLTGMRNLTHTYDVSWLILLTWALLIIGFAGTVFYRHLREFFASGCSK